ncbi:MAG: polyphosphate kinase 2 family protein [Bacteroidetes bacterium]|nr:polyphosphate kinase 2 family protein [Bacteroidota bacterium]
MRVEPGEKVKLKQYPTAFTGTTLTKETAIRIMDEGIEQVSRLQDVLYADDKHSLLIVLQAMDTAGKDGAIKHVMSGLNPQGVKVTSFKRPSDNELDHDFLWRHYQALPARGEIGIFNRSHYENVLVSKVHPEIVASEKLPGIDTSRPLPESFWKERYHVINDFERILVRSGTIVLKFFLHLSKEEQKRRLLSRIDDQEKNWKFSAADVHEREYWEAYQHAYEDAITATSTNHAPWYIIPADDKWWSRLALTTVLHKTVEDLDLRYPTVSKEQLAILAEARTRLVNE